MDDYFLSSQNLLKFFRCVASNGRMMQNGGLERMWKEAGVVYFEVISQHFYVGSDDNIVDIKVNNKLSMLLTTM